MVDMSAITTTPDLLAEMIMKCPDLRCAVKRIILKNIDEQCQKLCSRSQQKSSVLRIPRSKHKVKYILGIHFFRFGGYIIGVCMLDVLNIYINLLLI